VTDPVSPTGRARHVLLLLGLVVLNLGLAMLLAVLL